VEAAGLVETLASTCHATQLHTVWCKHHLIIQKIY